MHQAQSILHLQRVLYHAGLTNPPDGAVCPSLSERCCSIEQREVQEWLKLGFSGTHSIKAVVCTAGPVFHHLQLFN